MKKNQVIKRILFVCYLVSLLIWCGMSAYAIDSVVETRYANGRRAAITKDGILYCWGRNDQGQLGDGTTTDQETPVEIMHEVKTVSLGELHSAAITQDGSLYCWGNNAYGQLGDGTTDSKSMPVKIMEAVVGVYLGEYQSFAITQNGDLYCWGKNDQGQIGNHTRINCLKPVKVLDNVKSAYIRDDFSWAVTKKGEVYCWGKGQETPVKFEKQKPVVLQEQKISVPKKLQKTYKPNGKFELNAQITGEGKVSYKSSDPGIVKVSETTGKVTITGTGTANIEITVDEVEGKYKKAAVIVQITVKPAKLTAPKLTNISKGKVKVKWNAVSPNEKYTVEWSYNKNFKPSGKVSGTTTIFMLRNLSSKVTYYVRVCAKDGKWSKTVSIKVR